MSDPILLLAGRGLFHITPVRKVIVSDPPYLLEPSLNIEMTGPRVLLVEVSKQALKFDDFIVANVLPDLKY
jgi:hypothetical protein